MSDADCTTGREPRGVAASLIVAYPAGIALPSRRCLWLLVSKICIKTPCLGSKQKMPKTD